MSWVDLLEKLKTALSRGHDPVDRRSHNRVAFRMGVLATSTWVKKQREFIITDVGPGGVRVESKLELVNGDTCELLVPSKTMAPSGLTAYIAWSRKKRASDLYTGGLRFMLDTQKQRRAVAKFLLEDCKLGVLNPQEKRKYMRVSIPDDIDGTLFIKNGPKLPVKVRDLAIGGALLLSSSAVSPGTHATARILLVPDQPALDCIGSVVRVTPAVDEAGEAYELGMSFTKVDPNHEEALKSFLIQKLVASS